MPGALLLSPESPFPTAGGGALRTASLFEYLARRFTLDVITFRQPGAPDPRELFPMDRLRALHVIDLPRHSRAPLSRVARNLRRGLLNRPPLLDRFSGFDSQIAAAVAGRAYHVGIVEHFWCAPYEAQLRPACRSLNLDLHNIESNWHGSLARTASPWHAALHRRFAQAYEERERHLLPRFDQLLVASQREAGHARNRAPGANCLVYPNAIPWIAAPSRNERDEILFTGNLEYQPNISAVAWFAKKIWPSLRAEWPSLIWTVAGKNAQAVRHLTENCPGVQVCSHMPDAVERIAQAKIAVVPLLAGSGTRFKILEAWAAGTPVVSTSLGAEGLDAIPEKHLLLADTPSDFSRSVSNLLRDADRRTRIGALARQLYERTYTWERAWASLENLAGV